MSKDDRLCLLIGSYFVGISVLTVIGSYIALT